MHTIEIEAPAAERTSPAAGAPGPAIKVTHLVKASGPRRAVEGFGTALAGLAVAVWRFQWLPVTASARG